MPQKAYGNSRHYGCRYGEANRRHFIEAIVRAVSRRWKRGSWWRKNGQEKGKGEFEDFASC